MKKFFFDKVHGRGYRYYLAVARGTPRRSTRTMTNRTSGRSHRYVGDAIRGRKTFRRHPKGKPSSIHREPSEEVPELGLGYVSRVSVPLVSARRSSRLWHTANHRRESSSLSFHRERRCDFLALSAQHHFVFTYGAERADWSKVTSEVRFCGR